MILKHIANLAVPLALMLLPPAPVAGGETEPEDQQATVSGLLVGHTDCETEAEWDGRADIGADQSAVQWESDGYGTLDLHHLNAAFNCCPKLKCVVTVEGDVITVKEAESGGCDCACLIDTHYKIIGLRPGTYTVRFEELYLTGSDERLEFVVAVRPEPNEGIVAVYRDRSPWMPEDEPWGELLDPGEARDLGDIFVYNLPEDSNCLVYEHEDNILRLQHQGVRVNEGEVVEADIRVEGDRIYVEEHVYLPKPSICPAFSKCTLEIMIYNLPPALYDVSVVNKRGLYTAALDLIYAPSGYSCFESKADW